MTVQGRWADGTTARLHDVVVEAEPVGIRIGTTDGHQISLWSFDDIRVVDRNARGLTLTANSVPDTRLYLENGDILGENVARILDAGRVTPRDHRSLVRRLMTVAAAAVIVIGGLIVIPRTTNVVPWLLPESAKKHIGEHLAATLTEGKRYCTNPTAQTLLDALVRRLAPAEGATIRVMVVEAEPINAFAAPGGLVVVFSGLLKAVATPDEFAAVLAHEIAHDLHGHAINRLPLVIGLGALANIVVGGGGSLVAGAQVFALFAFSRADERAADRTALTILDRARIDPSALVAFFTRVEQEEQKKGLQLPEYLSTHPLTAERKQMVESVERGRAGYEPALSAEDWARVRSICG